MYFCLFFGYQYHDVLVELVVSFGGNNWFYLLGLTPVFYCEDIIDVHEMDQRYLWGTVVEGDNAANIHGVVVDCSGKS